MSRPAALLTDFGGVLTSNVFDSLTRFCRSEGMPDDHLRELFRSDAEAQRLLVEVETGVLPPGEYEQAFAEHLSHGRDPVAAAGLIDRMFGSIEPEPAVVEAVAALRRAGVRTLLVSNSLGFASYETLDMERLFDAVVISGEVGVRKPDPRIYVLAAERAGVGPGACVFVDDLPHNLRPAAELGMTTILHREAAETVRELADLFAVPLAA